MANFASKITFQNGSCREISRVEAIAQRGDDFVVVTETTPFHPRDFQWPDQPEDRGFIQTADGRRHTVADAVFVALSPTGIFSVDREIPVKKNDPDWYFCVGHLIRGERPLFARGEEIVLQVDEAYRQALSRAHSAAHLMALALDRSFAPLWRKEAPMDALGSPDFDGLAMDISTIGPLCCHDRYRLGKSLRKKGFSSDELRQSLKQHENEINASLATWLAQDTAISQRSDGDGLTSHRLFCTKIEDRDVEMPCGGTHVRSFAEIGSASVRLFMQDEETLIIDTLVK